VTALLRAAALSMAIAAVIAPAAEAGKRTDATLDQDLTRLAAKAGGKGGFVVLDGRTGRTLAASAPNTVRPLGSTAKLLTTGAALEQKRPSDLLATFVTTGAALVDGTLQGDLHLVGGGDPTLDEPQLAALAGAVQAHGVRAITGSIVGDESRLDGVRGGPASGGAFDPELGGVLGALTYARGRQAPGGPLQPDPARAAAFRFDDVLEARGLTIRGTPRTGVPGPGFVTLGRVGTRMGDVIKIINKTSDDFAAEILAKLLGDGHTTADAAGLIAARARAHHLRFTVVDGSGVDHDTSGAPLQLARYVRLKRGNPTLAASLPIAGVDGTLAQRMTSGPARGRCRAKTGSLPQTRVSALAGWCRTRGRTLVFALQRENVAGQAAAKSVEDAIVQRIAGSRRR
jgi:serine-type D-Ala-D-Ala carboxypeptidase/endopeptidase (penicillin-binding protein 4)